MSDVSPWRLALSGRTIFTLPVTVVVSLTLTLTLFMPLSTQNTRGVGFVRRSPSNFVSCVALLSDCQFETTFWSAVHWYVVPSGRECGKRPISSLITLRSTDSPTQVVGIAIGND